MLEIKMTERPKTIEKLARHVNRQTVHGKGGTKDS